ncbi:MAG: hypothetical protein ACREFP_18720 [Acetobacteraceae bacterium]
MNALPFHCDVNDAVELVRRERSGRQHAPRIIGLITFSQTSICKIAASAQTSGLALRLGAALAIFTDRGYRRHGSHWNLQPGSLKVFTTAPR